MGRYVLPVGILIIGRLMGLGIYRVDEVTKQQVDTTPYCITVKHTFTYTNSGIDASGKTVMFRDVARKGDLFCRPRR